MARQFTCCLSMVFMALVGLKTGEAIKCTDMSIYECKSQDIEKPCYDPEFIVKCLKNLTDCEGDDSLYRDQLVQSFQHHVDHPICPGITEEGACFRKELERCDRDFPLEVTEDHDWDKLCHEEHGLVKEIRKCFTDLKPKCPEQRTKEIIDDQIENIYYKCQTSDAHPDNKHE